MAKLSYKQRQKLPASSFAIPEKRAYPIEDKAHARDALARVSANGTPREKAEVRRAVHQKYPMMGEPQGISGMGTKDLMKAKSNLDYAEKHRPGGLLVSEKIARENISKELGSRADYQMRNVRISRKPPRITPPRPRIGR